MSNLNHTQKLERELATERKACEAFAELNVELEQQLERQEAYYMGDRAELAALREQIQALEMKVKGRNPDGTLIPAKPFHQ